MLAIEHIHDYYGAGFWQRKFRKEDCIDYYRWIRDADQFNRHENIFDYSFINDDLLRNTNRRIDVYPEYLRKHLREHFGIEADYPDLFYSSKFFFIFCFLCLFPSNSEVVIRIHFFHLWVGF